MRWTCSAAGIRWPTAVVAGILLFAAGWAHAQEVKFTFVNETGYDGVRIDYKAGVTSAPERLVADGSRWSKTIRVDDDKWSANPHFLVFFAGVSDGSHPVGFENMSIALPVRVRKTDSGEVVFPLRLFSSISGREMTRLESMSLADDQFERRMLGEQIAKHYIGSLGDHSNALARRAIGIWMDAAFSLTRDTENRFRMSDEAATAIGKAWEGNANREDRYRRLTREASSLHWNDIRQIVPLLSQRKCEEARQLLRELQQDHEARPELAAMRIPGSIDDVMAERRRMVGEACDDPS